MYLFFKKITFFVCIIAIFTRAELSSDIEQISTLTVLEEQLDSLDSDALVVFDVDEVIFTDQDVILKPVGDPLKFQIFNERYAEAETAHEKDLTTSILSLPLIKAKKVLVEELTPQLIDKLQKKSIKVIALTSCPTRPFGIIKNFEKWRLNHIQGFCINFEKSFPDQKRFVFENITANNVPPPVYNQGVIFAEGFSKADVLAAFLKKLDFKPSKVIFIDDMYSNLQQMETKLTHMGIPHKGYYYIRVHADSEGDLNEEVARFQFDYLFKHQKWLSDQEAKEKLYLES